MHRICRNESGAALVIALVMLLVLTILAFTGLNTSVTETVMATNEQFRQSAGRAASAGVEAAIGNIGAVATTRGAAPVASGWRNLGASPVDQFNTRTQFLGDERNLPQSSADKFVGLHFSIESEGRSARNARDQQVQGVFVVASTGGNSDFGQTGTGLE
jgi:hypothetical protein